MKIKLHNCKKNKAEIDRLQAEIVRIHAELNLYKKAYENRYNGYELPKIESPHIYASIKNPHIYASLKNSFSYPSPLSHAPSFFHAPPLSHASSFFHAPPLSHAPLSHAPPLPPPPPPLLGSHPLSTISEV